MKYVKLFEDFKVHGGKTYKCQKTSNNHDTHVKESYYIPSGYDDNKGLYISCMTDKDTQEQNIIEAATYEYKDNSIYFKYKFREK